MHAYVRAAGEHIEGVTEQPGLVATYRMTISRFPYSTSKAYLPFAPAAGHIILPRWPVIGVTGIQYVDTDNVTQTLDPTLYQYTTDYRPCRIGPARLTVWPWSDPYTMNGVRVTFTAGYATAAAVPQNYKQALRFLGSYWFYNRESDVDGKMPDSLKFMIKNLDGGYNA
jgi:uncharacterized phiE125 gp8 family phage protein